MHSFPQELNPLKNQNKSDLKFEKPLSSSPQNRYGLVCACPSLGQNFESYLVMSGMVCQFLPPIQGQFEISLILGFQVFAKQSIRSTDASIAGNFFSKIQILFIILSRLSVLFPVARRSLQATASLLLILVCMPELWKIPREQLLTKIVLKFRLPWRATTPLMSKIRLS